jgi:hypothetical protein
MWPLALLIIFHVVMSVSICSLNRLGAVGKLLVGVAATLLFILAAAVAVASVWGLRSGGVPVFAEDTTLIPVVLAFAYAYLAAEVFVLLNRSNKALQRDAGTARRSRRG